MPAARLMLSEPPGQGSGHWRPQEFPRSQPVLPLPERLLAW